MDTQGFQFSSLGMGPLEPEQGPATRRRVSRAILLLAALVAGALLAAGASAHEPRITESKAVTSELVNAQTRLVAAIECRKRGYRFMLRLSPYYVTCLRTNAGVSEAIDVNAVLRPQS